MDAGLLLNLNEKLWWMCSDGQFYCADGLGV